jgi:arylsulfatase A-like enzyme
MGPGERHRMTEGLKVTGLAAQALWFGLLTGLTEAALVTFKQRVLGRYVRMSPEIVWMAPVMDAILFLVIAAVLALLSRAWTPLGRRSSVTFVLAFFSCLSVLFMYYPLQDYAKVLLAIGVAMQAARLAARWPSQHDRLVRVGVIAMTATVAILAGVSRIWPAIAYERQVRSLSAAAPGAPNVLLIVWDTVRAANLSVYGYQRKTTPNLEGWAGSSAIFDKASSASPWTLPSHASMLTGQWPQALSTDWEQAMDGRHRTLAETLAGHGYVTAGFVANTYYCGRELGLARGFAHYEDYVVSLRELLINSTLLQNLLNSTSMRQLSGYEDNIPRRSAKEITDQFLSWQSGAGGRPFFAFLNFFDAHETYLPPPPFDGKFGPGPPIGSPQVIQDVRRSLRRDWPQRSREEIQGELDMYDGAIAYLDDQLHRLLTTLQARGQLDNTIVIVTADHGEQFGEHGLFLHGNSLYQPLLHVPLMIRFPARVPAGRIDARVTLRDLAATIVDFASLGSSTGLPGTSLARFWSGTSQAGAAIAEVREADWARSTAPWYPAAKGNMASVTDEAFHYIRNGDGSEELYAVGDDGERNDLSRRPESQPILERYRRTLQASVDGKGH